LTLCFVLDWAGARCQRLESCPVPLVNRMEAFFVSALVVTLGEIGDKTQLLALLLAARFRRPVPIVAGILVATLFNHALAGVLGNWIRSAVDPGVLRWALGISFLGIAAWALIPDKMEEEHSAPMGRCGVFVVTLVAFFLAEIGDKTQLATVALAARFDSLVAVVCGTTVGMLIADVPAVFLGDRASAKIPFRAIRYAAAALFAAVGVAVLVGFQLT
jgi:putative Ca2+/H+ antiporter (TMEM165/GDT1 family)